MVLRLEDVISMNTGDGEMEGGWTRKGVRRKGVMRDKQTRIMEVTIRRGECAEMSECKLKCEENTSREENKENMGVNALE